MTDTHMQIETLETRLAMAGDLPNVHPAGTVDYFEHAQLAALVPGAAVTHEAVQSGEWDQPSTWQDGVIPTDEANVLIPHGLTVTLDSVETARLRTVRIDGELEFSPTVNTQILVDTAVVSPGGRLEIGTAETPIAADVTAKMVIIDRGAIDLTWDKTQLSRGLIAHGETSIYGSEVTAFVPLVGGLAKDATKIELDALPTGWSVGDTLMFPGVNRGQSETRTITAVTREIVSQEVWQPLAYEVFRDVLTEFPEELVQQFYPLYTAYVAAHQPEPVFGKASVEFAPLTFSHSTPSEITIPVSNLTRNVIFESENKTDRLRAGHVMFMHSDDVAVHNAVFDELGRTDKINNLNSTKLDANGEIVPGTGTNHVGRYALHFHRTGLLAPIEISGVVISNANSFGINNHHGHVHVSGSVVYGAVGSAFMAEAGDELGSFQNSVAVNVQGSGLIPAQRAFIAEPDFGHEGAGFWAFPGVSFVGNFAADTPFGFVMYGQGLKELNPLTGKNANDFNFPVANIADPAMRAMVPAGITHILPGGIPFRAENNTAVAASQGFATLYQREIAWIKTPSQIVDYKAYNVRSAMTGTYTFHTDVHNMWAENPTVQLNTSGYSPDEVTSQTRFYTPHIVNFALGIAAPSKFANVIDGGYLNNVIDIRATPNSYHPSTLDIRDVVFGQLGTVPPGAAQYDLYMWGRYTFQDYAPNAKRFNPAQVVTLNGQRVYLKEQAASYVPFPDTKGNPPAEWVGLTNQQLKDQFGLEYAGAVAPADAVQPAGVFGLMAP